MEKGKTFFRKTWLDPLPNVLEQFIPDSARYAEVLKVYEVEGLSLLADILSRKVVCFH